MWCVFLCVVLSFRVGCVEVVSGLVSWSVVWFLCNSVYLPGVFDSVCGVSCVRLVCYN